MESYLNLRDTVYNRRRTPRVLLPLLSEASPFDTVSSLFITISAFVVNCHQNHDSVTVALMGTVIFAHSENFILNFMQLLNDAIEKKRSFKLQYIFVCQN